MKVQDAIVLITGANRGIGQAFAEAALERGARKVYAGARRQSSITNPGLDFVQLDVTSDQDVAAAARRCGDGSRHQQCGDRAGRRPSWV